MVTEDERIQLKLLSFLLDYPDAGWFEGLAGVGDVVDGLADGRSRTTLRRFLACAESTPAIRLQEAYTAAFDLHPATSLNLTYHFMGDSEDRGKALARLVEIYRRSGWDAAACDLPDFLPMMLEFLAVCPAPEDADLLWTCLGGVGNVAGRLAREQHPYAGLLALAADILAARTQDTTDSPGKEA
jgi:nitrate reductase delta subunit